jgi:hypothetical protein
MEPHLIRFSDLLELLLCPWLFVHVLSKCRRRMVGSDRVGMHGCCGGREAASRLTGWNFLAFER